MDNRDRVSYSFGMKLPGKEPYPSIDFHVSLSSDAYEGESPEDAFERVQKSVLEKAKSEYARVNKMRGRG